MLKVWEESFEIIISSSGCVHLLGRVVEPSGGVGSPFEAVVFPCDADPVNEVVCVFLFLQQWLDATEQAESGEGVCQAGPWEDGEAKVKVFCKRATSVESRSPSWVRREEGTWRYRTGVPELWVHSGRSGCHLGLPEWQGWWRKAAQVWGQWKWQFGDLAGSSFRDPAQGYIGCLLALAKCVLQA